MKERPILFSGPMVREVLAGRKTQTRRLVRDSAGPFTGNEAPGWWNMLACPYGRPGTRLWVRETWRTGVELDHMSPAAIADRCISAGYAKPWAPLKYEADGATRDEHYLRAGGGADFGGDWGKTRVAIHLPRWAARIEIDVIDVRVERLQSITEDDARAEGVLATDAVAVFEGGAGRRRDMERTARGAFACLWDSINGDRALWSTDPWVWVVEFRAVKP